MNGRLFNSIRISISYAQSAHNYGDRQLVMSDMLLKYSLSQSLEHIFESFHPHKLETSNTHPKRTPSHDA